MHSVIAHETDTGYAQCFREDVDNPRMELIDLEAVTFSPAEPARIPGPAA